MNKNLKLRLTGIGKLLSKEKTMLINGGSGSGGSGSGSGHCPDTSPKFCNCSGTQGRCISQPSSYPTCACETETGCIVTITPECY